MLMTTTHSMDAVDEGGRHLNLTYGAQHESCHQANRLDEQLKGLKRDLAMCRGTTPFATQDIECRHCSVSVPSHLYCAHLNDHGDHARFWQCVECGCDGFTQQNILATHMLSHLDPAG